MYCTDLYQYIGPLLFTYVLCRLVAESLKEVEEEQEAMEAELVRLSSTQSRERESSPDTFDVGTPRAVFVLYEEHTLTCTGFSRG